MIGTIAICGRDKWDEKNFGIPYSLPSCKYMEENRMRQFHKFTGNELSTYSQHIQEKHYFHLKHSTQNDLMKTFTFIHIRYSFSN